MLLLLFLLEFLELSECLSLFQLHHKLALSTRLVRTPFLESHILATVHALSSLRPAVVYVFLKFIPGQWQLTEDARLGSHITGVVMILHQRFLTGKIFAVLTSDLKQKLVIKKNF